MKVLHYTYHKAVNGQILTTPRVGQIVIIKEANVPRGIWKLGKIENLIKGADGQVRTAQVRLTNNRNILRAINQLYPLEVPNQDLDKGLSSKETDESLDPKQSNQSNESEQSNEPTDSDKDRRFPIRKAAIIARQRINQLQRDDAVTVLFIIT